MSKTYKVEVEIQLDKRIKQVRSERDGEYYERFDGEQYPGSYTMPGFSSMNGITKRQNRIPKDMVKSMISHFSLPKSL